MRGGGRCKYGLSGCRLAYVTGGFICLLVWERVQMILVIMELLEYIKHQIFHKQDVLNV